MSKRLKRELLEIVYFAGRNRRELLVVSLATLFLVLARYHRLEDKWLNYVVYYFTLPVLSIVVILRRNPLDFGLRPGNYRVWSVHVAVACVVTIALLFVSARFSSVDRFYDAGGLTLPRYAVSWAALLFSLEFLYRGFLIFGLRERFGEGAVLIQMIPFTLLHIGKPEIETVGCILSGTYFGYVAYRTNSIWPAFLIHLFANVANRIIVGI
jgi:membrane protease YdiL (CAAX protease family)